MVVSDGMVLSLIHEGCLLVGTVSTCQLPFPPTFIEYFDRNLFCNMVLDCNLPTFWFGSFRLAWVHVKVSRGVKRGARLLSGWQASLPNLGVAEMHRSSVFKIAPRCF